tara:strand:- start:1253 stop:1900 length:648 start_codon:yes stop_codon:yes gene_type:complete
MSHNIIKVNNVLPNNQGNIPVNMDSYINTSSLSNDNIVSYDGSNWINNSASFPVSLSAGWINISGSYSNGNYPYSVGHYFMNRRGTNQGITYASNATLNSATGANTPLNSGDTNNTWFESVKLSNAGTYLCMFSINCSTGNSISFRWQDHDDNYFSNKASVEKNNNSWGAICTGIVTTTGSNKIVKLVCTDVSGSVQLTDPQEGFNSSMTIMKLA